MQNVLVLEDDMIAVTLAMSLLEEAGYFPEFADNTDAALIAIERSAPDILLSDWSLEGSISAGDVARHLRKRKPESTIVFITGRSLDELEMELADLTPFRLFQKPVEYESIIGQLRRSE